MKEALLEGQIRLPFPPHVPAIQLRERDRKERERKSKREEDRERMTIGKNCQSELFQNSAYQKAAIT